MAAQAVRRGESNSDDAGLLRHYPGGVSRVSAAQHAVPAPAWLRPAVAGGAAAISLLAVVADGYFYPDATFPLAIWLAVVVIGLSWGAELSGVRLPIWLLGALQLAPLCWLAVLRRGDVVPLFLLLLIAWVGYTRTRREGILMLVCCLGYFWLATPTTAADGTVRLVGWYSWPIAFLWASSMVSIWQWRLLTVPRAMTTSENSSRAPRQRARICRRGESGKRSRSRACVRGSSSLSVGTLSSFGDLRVVPRPVCKTGARLSNGGPIPPSPTLPCSLDASVAQLARANGSYPCGSRFNSWRGHQPCTARW
jgi:hypothetical protein